MNLEPEDQLSSDQEVRADSLTAQELSRIDAALMSHARPQWRKLAMIVALAMADCGGQITNVPDAFYSRRAAQLVSEGKLLASGDLRRMRYCEIKLPES
jgi:hypothetical protein